MTRHFLYFDWTLENYALCRNARLYASSCGTRSSIAGGSTLLGYLVRPSRMVDGFRAVQATKDILLWMLSTKMLPAVGVLYPISLLFVQLNLLDTRSGLMVVLMLINLPIIVWMLYTTSGNSRGNPRSRADGRRYTQRGNPLCAHPMAIPGIASTLLLNFILAWNEAFWTLNLTAAKAAPLTAFIASYSSPEGLFFAKLSAARPWPSRRSSSLAGSARNNLSAA